MSDDWRRSVTPTHEHQPRAKGRNCLLGTIYFAKANRSCN
jgi:hypothetical protein